MSIYAIIAVIVAALNIVAFAAFGIDKWKAQHNKWRIPESTLLLLALLGGAIGAYAGMKVFHHKTKHKKFTILVPLFVILHLGCLLYFLLRTS